MPARIIKAARKIGVPGWGRGRLKVFPCNVISMWKYYPKSTEIASDLSPMAYLYQVSCRGHATEPLIGRHAMHFSHIKN
jgi:hypothetical protein